MLLSLFYTVVFVAGLSYFASRDQGKFPASLLNRLRQFQLSQAGLLDYLALFLFLCFCLFPLIWGLAFFLQTDANVVVVLVFLAWVYNWSRWVWKEEV